MDLSQHLQKAEEATRRRNYPLAIAVYQQILDIHPDSADARRGLRIALDKKFEGKKGAGALSRVTGFLPLLSAGISKLTKSHAGRARSLERFLALAPNDVGANLALGESLYRAGHTSSAYVVYRHLGEKLGQGGSASKHAEAACVAWRSAGAVAWELKKLDEAMECYEAALQINPRDQESLRARKNLSAEGQLGAGGYATAKSSRDLVKDKAQQKGLEKAQRLHRSEDEVKDELQDIEARLAASPDDADLLGKVGALRAQAGDTAGALECLEKALTHKPGDVTLLRQVGDMRVKEIERDIEKARKLGDEDRVGDLEKRIIKTKLDVTRQLVAAHPTDLGLRHDLGTLLLAQGDLDAAIAEFQKSVKDPRHKLDALYGLGVAFRQKGLLDLARTQLEKAVETAGAGHAKQLELLYELGGLAEQENNVEDARKHYGRILEVDIQFRDVSKKLESLSAKDANS